MEEFIKKNRQAFDDAQPSVQVWERIEAELHRPQTKMVEISMLYKVAASVAVILSLGVLLGYYVGSRSQMNSIEQQLAGVETYYQQKMEERMDLLDSYNATQVVQEELNGLESGYAKLVSERPLDEERYMQAVMANFEARLEVLEKVILQMEKYSNKGKINNNEIKDLQI